MYYEIVPMDRSHIEQIAELERNCFSTPWTENMLTDALFDPQASFIVAEDGEGGVLGYAGLHVVLDEGYIDNVAVEQAARRHGVASALLEDPTLLNTPIVRNGKQATVGYHPEIWETWT